VLGSWLCALDDQSSTEAVIRAREEIAEQIRALHDLRTMAASYGHDISGPSP
jgi:formate C-acetyltransferase